MKTTILFTLAIAFAFVSQAQIVNIPDANFKSALISNGVDTNTDGEIQVSEAEAVAWLDVSNTGINNLTGIEAFVNITDLDCSDNDINSVNFSNNTSLTNLYCFSCNLSFIDLGYNNNLSTIECGDNNLTSLSVDYCPNIVTLSCGINNISYLQLTNCTQLEYLICPNNLLNDLDLSNNSSLYMIDISDNNFTSFESEVPRLNLNNNQITSLNLTSYLMELYCSGNQLTELNIQSGLNDQIMTFDATNNPDLECILVDDVAWSNTNWTNIDAQSYFSINCAFQISETHADIMCNDSNDGYISIMASGGLEPYTFDWTGPNGYSNIGTDATITDLEAGEYCVTVTDTILEIRTLCVTITEPDPIEVLIVNSNPITCFGECTGFFEVTATGGSPGPGYLYEWSNSGPMIPEITDLCAGDYYVTITDGNGCEAVSQIMTVGENAEIVITSTIINNLCAGDTLGSIDIAVTGGSPSYIYSWQYPLNLETEDVENLSADYYCVTVVDFIGCDVIECFTITEPAPIVISLDNLENATNGVCNGSIETIPMGGTIPYTFEWSTGEMYSQNISDLCSGAYGFTVMDNNFCVAQESYEVGSSYDGVYTFVDTLNPVIDTCIFDNTNPVDSALIYDYNLVGADSIQLNWIFWQAGTSITLDMTVFLETTGSNLVYLEIICNGSKSINSATTYSFYGMFDTQTVGLKELENTSLSVYPNPTTGKITIESSNVEQIEIYNLSGVLIQSTNSKEVDLSQEAKGIYFVKLITKEGTTTEKIILE